MPLLTKKEYIDLAGCSRQNVEKKMIRGTLKTRTVKQEVEQTMIELTDEEYADLSS